MQQYDRPFPALFPLLRGFAPASRRDIAWDLGLSCVKGGCPWGMYAVDSAHLVSPGSGACCVTAKRPVGVLLGFVGGCVAACALVCVWWGGVTQCVGVLVCVYVGVGGGVHLCVCVWMRALVCVR